jgi:hypothetical protein
VPANRAFLEQKWKKRHHWTVEECLAINAYDVIACIRGLPKLPIIEQRAGACVRKYLECPRCECVAQHLFLPPPTACERCEANRDWACRECHELVYASQRYGRRHPLRIMGPPRKRAARTLGQLLPSWYDEPRVRQRAARGKFDLLHERFRWNAYGIPIRRVA